MLDCYFDKTNFKEIKSSNVERHKFNISPNNSLKIKFFLQKNEIQMFTLK